jgi:hypothetical protein
MNDKDIDLINHFNLLKYKSVFNPLYLRLSAFYSFEFKMRHLIVPIT